jgi:hypothetical protein
MTTVRNALDLLDYCLFANVFPRLRPAWAEGVDATTKKAKPVIANLAEPIGPPVTLGCVDKLNPDSDAGKQHEGGEAEQVTDCTFLE